MVLTISNELSQNYPLFNNVASTSLKLVLNTVYTTRRAFVRNFLLVVAIPTL